VLPRSALMDIALVIDHPDSFRLDPHGAERVKGVLQPFLGSLHAILEFPEHRAGSRVSGLRNLEPFLANTGPIGSIVAARLGPCSRAVRAILFDKSANINWSLGWHQDRTICVRERIDVDGFGPWTMKGSMQHVCPPFELLSRMLTLRVHLDDVGAANAPLLIAPGSHRFGRVPEPEIDRVVSACGTAACTADAGDVWVYATPILHASEAARTPARRRVLQIDFSGDNLPGGLEWLGV
jgi:hypothetical protein